MELLDRDAGKVSLKAAMDESDGLDGVNSELSRLTYDTFAEDFITVGQILSDDKVCSETLRGLDKALFGHIKEPGRLRDIVLTKTAADKVGLGHLANGDPKVQRGKLKDAKEAYGTAQKSNTEYFQKTDGALQTVLAVAELKIGFYPKPPQLSGEVAKGYKQGNMPLMRTGKALKGDEGKTAHPVTLTGFAKSGDFGSLLKQFTHWKDPGAPLLHGEFTHRIQWWIVCSALNGSGYKFKHALPEVFAAFPDLKAHRSNAGGLRSAWDWACDQILELDKGNLKVQKTFRNPEHLHQVLLGDSELAANAPHLRGILRSRVNKRAYFSMAGVTMGDYMTGKYG